MGTQYRVTLTKEEVEELQAFCNKGTHPSRAVLCARALLLLDRGENNSRPWKLEEVSGALGMTTRTLNHLKKRFVTEGLERALNRKPQERPSRQVKFDGEFEAKLTLLACSDPPKGYKRWTVRLLADKAVELEFTDKISPMSVQRLLKKKELKPHLSDYWKIQEGRSGEFVARMEDVLDVYTRPYDAKRPVICMDESPKQLIGEVREPIPMQPGKVRKIDDEYMRFGTAEIFGAIEPLKGKQFYEVQPTRTKADWARFIKRLVDEEYADAEKIVLVMDNLNTHTVGSLYEAFSPEEAHRISEKLEIHYTPKHGSWLNIQEIGFSMLKRQCLPERVESIEELREQIDTWTKERNNGQHKVNWQFTTEDARIKLRRLYPEFE